MINRARMPLVGILQTALLCAPLIAQEPAAGPAKMILGEAVRHDTSAPLRELARASSARGLPAREIRHGILPVRPGKSSFGPDLQDPVRQMSLAPMMTASLTPRPFASFEGLSDDQNKATVGFVVVPPDTEGDVGLRHYVQVINSIFAVWDKRNPGGGPTFGPAPANLFWQGFGGICETNNDGDPVVLYDHLADRWLVSQFALGADGHQCLAVSTGGDPTGSYYRYDFVVSPGAWNDYPKLGVWPDGYYLSVNEFAVNFTAFRGARAVVFERDKMLLGMPARLVNFGPLSSGPLSQEYGLLPSHLEGPPPAAGTLNTFIRFWDTFPDDGDAYRLWSFSVDWSVDPPAAQFVEQPRVPTAPFTSNLCNFNRACIPQPKGGELLDAFSGLLMYRAQFRHFAAYDTIVVNHTVDVNGLDLAGVRWAELRRPIGGAWSMYQTGTFSPTDGNHRWMGSIAMNGAGSIALGYSVSGTSTFPSIRYATRAVDDPPGVLAGGEAELIAGGGSQKNSFNRWGDYSTMSVDPEDDCTFWYTQEYYAKNGTFDFKTRIGAFKPQPCACVPTQTPETSCGDALDNDCNGLIDCDDPACSTSPSCVKCALGKPGDPCIKDTDCCSDVCRPVGGTGALVCKGS